MRKGGESVTQSLNLATQSPGLATQSPGLVTTVTANQFQYKRPGGLMSFPTSHFLDWHSLLTVFGGSMVFAAAR